MADRLSRATHRGRPAAPVRIAHLGLGGFARSHQAWYTALAPDAGDWGIAAFTGRSPDLARRLQPQDGLYTLVTRGEGGPSYAVLDSISAVYAASDHAAWLAVLARPELAVVTLSVTEAGYCRNVAGGLDPTRDDVQHDLAALRADLSSVVSTVPGRLVAGLAARRRAGSGALTILPCDNLPHNGAATRLVVTELAGKVDGDLASWVSRTVSFASCVVDRITPRTVAADREEVRQVLGLWDDAPVVTEPFSEWVISGAFPAGRPQWESVGVRFVDDVEPFETRKLWLLNGAHTILALAGGLRGHRTVADAVADPLCRSWIEQWWDEAQPHLTLPEADVADYRAALLTRFANPAIDHQLAQVSMDSSQKIPVRILPVLRAERASGRLPEGAARAVAAWVAQLRMPGADVDDPARSQLAALVDGPLESAVAGVLGFLDPLLRKDVRLVEAVVALSGSLTDDQAVR
jgi:fructuronate reductase